MTANKLPARIITRMSRPQSDGETWGQVGAYVQQMAAFKEFSPIGEARNFRNKYADYSQHQFLLYRLLRGKHVNMPFMFGSDISIGCDQLSGVLLVQI